MKKDDLLKFEIDQLRKDKMIYALESIALSFILEVSYFLITIIKSSEFSYPLAGCFLVVGVSYYIYMLVGNLLRLSRIKKLEKQLYGK